MAHHPHLKLVRDASAGNEGLDGLYRQHFATITRLIQRRFGGGPPDPEDVAQAAFERFARLPDRGQVLDIQAFLARAARNIVLDHYRASRVRDLHARDVRSEGASFDFDAEHVLLARERLSVVEAAIRDMDGRRRDVLIMNRLGGLSSAEIARRLGCSPTLVKMRLAEAVVLCHQALRLAGHES